MKVHLLHERYTLIFINAMTHFTKENVKSQEQKKFSLNFNYVRIKKTE